MKEVPGRNGGTIMIMEKGDTPPAGAGRPRNRFKEHIRELSEGVTGLIVKAKLLDADGVPTGEIVTVEVELPGAMAVVVKAFKQAAKGDAQARRWLSETGYGRTINLASDQDSPIGGGFVLVLPDNQR